jgi:nicotinamidase-related amidase
MRDWLIATNNTVGQREHEIVDEIKPLSGDLVLNKNTMGAFGSTGIDAHLRSMGIRNVVVTGVSTNNCVGMTAQEASDRQYGVVMVSDATGTCSDEMQEATLKTFRRLWGRVATTAEVIAELQRTP